MLRRRLVADMVYFHAWWWCQLVYIFGVFQLWDIRDGLCHQTFTGHENDVNAVAVRKTANMEIFELKCHIIHTSSMC